jgi:hypothetical protein
MPQPKACLALVAAFVLASQVFIAPASAAPGSNPAAARLDDAIVNKLKVTPESQRIPVIVEGATNASDGATETANERRAQRAEDRVRGNGGNVASNSNLLGARAAQSPRSRRTTSVARAVWPR